MLVRKAAEPMSRRARGPKALGTVSDSQNYWWPRNCLLREALLLDAGSGGWRVPLALRCVALRTRSSGASGVAGR